MQLRQVLAAFRAETREFSDHEVLRELREVITDSAARDKEMDKATADETDQEALAGTTTGLRPMWQASTRLPAEQPVTVKITYCAECGYEPQTLALTSALMMEFRDRIATLELIPWHGGAFDVVVDGELVHSMARDGGFPENRAICDAVRRRLGVPQMG